MLEHLDPEAVRKEIDPELLSVEANDTAIQLLLVSLLDKICNEFGACFANHWRNF